MAAYADNLWSLRFAQCGKVIIAVGMQARPPRVCFACQTQHTMQQWTVAISNADHHDNRNGNQGAQSEQPSEGYGPSWVMIVTICDWFQLRNGEEPDKGDGDGRYKTPHHLPVRTRLKPNHQLNILVEAIYT